MSFYLMPVITAIILFPLAAFLLSIPYAAWQYHVYGSISKFKLLIVFSFIFYLLCAYFLIILPLPDKNFVAHLRTPWCQLVPFNALHYFITHTSWRPLEFSTYLTAFKQNAFIQPFFNLVLTIPLGVYLRYLTKWSLPKIILASFLLSLFFELTQLSGLYFIYPRPYRLFDVDDLILNTSGGVFGYLLEPMLTKLFPSIDQLNQLERNDRDTASFWRRLTALTVDLLIFNLGFDLLALLNPNWGLTNLSSFIVGVSFYFIALPYYWQGATLGKRLVKIKLVNADETPIKLPALISRQIWLHGLGLANLHYLMPTIYQHFTAAHQQYRVFYLLIFIIAILVLGLFFINAVILIINKKRRMFYEYLTHTKEIGY